MVACPVSLCVVLWWLDFLSGMFLLEIHRRVLWLCSDDPWMDGQEGLMKRMLNSFWNIVIIKTRILLICQASLSGTHFLFYWIWLYISNVLQQIALQNNLYLLKLFSIFLMSHQTSMSFSWILCNGSTQAEYIVKYQEILHVFQHFWEI